MTPERVAPAPVAHDGSAGCGYDSLNVGTESLPGQPSVGSDVHPNGVFISYSGPTSPYPHTNTYCDGTSGANQLRLDDGSWGGYTPLATITTTGASDD